MSVLIECLNVVVPVDVLEQKFPGGAAEYRARRPNDTYVSDGLLTRVAFMARRDVQLFTGALELLGLVPLDDRGHAVDFVVIDQFNGPATPCDWIEFAPQPQLYAAAAWLKSAGAPRDIYCPPGWEPNPQRVQLVGEVESGGFRFAGVQDGVDVFENARGEKRYIGRPFHDGKMPFADLRR